MKYIDDIRDWLIANNLVAGYRVQLYELNDEGKTTDRFIVIQPDSGQPATGETRSPFARLLVIGKKSESFQGSSSVTERADDIIKAMQGVFSFGDNFLMVPVSDVSPPARTTDGRPYCQINLRILANKEG